MFLTKKILHLSTKIWCTRQKRIEPNAGKIKFDKTDPYVLQFVTGRNERGFTDNMVGGTIVIPGMYTYTITREKIVEKRKQLEG